MTTNYGTLNLTETLLNLDQARGVLNMLTCAIKQNSEGLYSRNTNLYFDIKNAAEIVTFLVNKLLPIHENKEQEIDLINSIGETLAMLRRRFEYDITQNYLTNEASHKTDADNDICLSSFAVETLIVLAANSFNVEETSDPLAA